MVSQPTGSSNRRVVNFLGEHGSVCISSDMSETQSHSTYDKISVSNNTNCTPVAEKELVYRSPANVSCDSTEITNSEQFAVSAKDTNLSSKSSTTESYCLAAVNRSFKSKGFSRDTRKLMVASWWTGTQKDYAVKFSKFNSWCSKREIDPYTASLTDCADFLTNLFHAGLKYRIISGYRSMLSALLPPVDKVPVGQHSDIIRLLKGGLKF